MGCYTKASNLKSTTHFESDEEIYFDFSDYPDDHHDTHVPLVSPHTTNSSGGEPQPTKFPPVESVSIDLKTTVLGNVDTKNDPTTSDNSTNSQ